jgi:hypothetical protein
MCRIINLEFIEESMLEDCKISIYFNTDFFMHVPHVNYNYTNLHFIKELYINEFSNYGTPEAVILHRVCPINKFINLNVLLIDNCVYHPSFFECLTIPLKTLVLYRLYKYNGFFTHTKINKYKFDKLPPTITEIIFCEIDIHNYNLQNDIVRIKCHGGEEYPTTIDPHNFLFTIDFFEKKYKKYIDSTVNIIFTEKYEWFKNVDDKTSKIILPIITNESYKSLYDKIININTKSEKDEFDTDGADYLLS